MITKWACDAIHLTNENKFNSDRKYLNKIVCLKIQPESYGSITFIVAFIVY